MLLLALGLLAGCAQPDGDPRLYESNDLQLTVGNSARMGCTCMFIMEMPEAYCREFVRASPDVAKLRFDLTRKRVEASAFISIAFTAHFVDEKRGCVLE